MRLITIVIGLSLLFIFILSGCAQQQTKYICSDGTSVSNPSLCPKQESKPIEQKAAEPTNCAEFKQRYGFATCGDGQCGMGEQEGELCSCPKDCDPYYPCSSDSDCSKTKPYCQLSKQYNKKICVGLSWMDGCDTDANCITPKPRCYKGSCYSQEWWDATFGKT